MHKTENEYHDVYINVIPFRFLSLENLGQRTPLVEK